MASSSKEAQPSCGKMDQLLEALKERHLDIDKIKRLITDDKIDMNSISDQYSNTVLHLVIRKVENDNPKHVDFVQYLLKNKADITAENTAKETPFLLAARLDKYSVIRILAEQKGNDINAENSPQGNTALHVAVMENHPKVVRLLRTLPQRLGLREDKLNNSNLTALKMCSSNDYPKITPEVIEIMKSKREDLLRSSSQDSNPSSKNCVSGEVEPMCSGHKAKCQHKLRDISCNDIKEFSLRLDPGLCGSACKGIMCLMRQVLSDEKEVIDIWRSCYGGISSAMDFLHYIGNKGITLHTLMSHMGAGGRSLVDCMKQCIERNTLEVFIHNLPNGELEEIAMHLSVKERPTNRNLQFTWKDVASKVGLSMTEIDALDSQCQTVRGNESITEAFIHYLNAGYPNYPVVQLKNGLNEIRRNDVIRECKMFACCIEEECFL